MSTNKSNKPKLRFKGFSDDWEQRKVGDYYEFKNGLNKGKELFGEGTPIVNFTDIFHNRGISPEMLSGKVRLNLSEIKNYEVKKGDIFFTRTSETIDEIGYPSVMLGEPENTVFSGFVLRGRCFLKDDPLDNLFKKYIFFTDAFRTEMLRKSSMTTRALTSGTAIKNMEFLHPSSKEEQHKIGELLTNIDHLITLHQRKCDNLKIIKKSMLDNLFPKNGEKVPKWRFKGFNNDWEQRKFYEIAQRESAAKKSSTDFPSVEYEDVVSEVGILNKDVRFKETQKTGIGFDGSQVLYGKLRPYLHNWLSPDFSGVAVGDWWVLKPVNIDKSFLFRLIQTEKFDDIANQSSGSKMPRADWNLVSNTEFMVPAEIEEERKIGQYFSELDHLITLHQSEVERLKKAKQFFLDKMFI